MHECLGRTQNTVGGHRKAVEKLAAHLSSRNYRTHIK